MCVTHSKRILLCGCFFYCNCKSRLKKYSKLCIFVVKMPRRKRLECRFELMEEEMSEGFAPVQRNAANARERARMRVLSSAFGRLKTKLPNIPADTKLSKLDTLRLATIYIRQLKAAVEEERGDKEQFNKHHATDASGRNISGESCRVTDRMVSGKCPRLPIIDGLCANTSSRKTGIIM